MIRFDQFRHKAVLQLKQLLYSRKGESYSIKGTTLHYLPGTRPVRTHYLHSLNKSARLDALQVKLLTEGLKEGDTAIDVGAHAGQYCLLMAAKCGRNGSVVAFEPDPYAREKLLKNISLNPTLKPPVVEAFACSDREGEGTLFSRGGNSQSSLVRSAVEFSVKDKSEKIRVPLVTLDAYVADHRLSTPHWVKIDTEGAEIRILKGAKKLLGSSAEILCELHPYAWPEFGNTFEEFKAIVAASGRRISYIDGGPVEDEPSYGVVILERVRHG